MLKIYKLLNLKSISSNNIGAIGAEKLGEYFSKMQNTSNLIQALTYKLFFANINIKFYFFLKLNYFYQLKMI